MTNAMSKFNENCKYVNYILSSINEEMNNRKKLVTAFADDLQRQYQEIIQLYQSADLNPQTYMPIRSWAVDEISFWLDRETGNWKIEIDDQPALPGDLNNYQITMVLWMLAKASTDMVSNAEQCKKAVLFNLTMYMP